MLVCGAVNQIKQLRENGHDFSSMPLEVRAQIPTLRLWCLAEISAAVQQEILAIVVKCGYMRENPTSGDCRPFQADASVLGDLVDLIDVSTADATVYTDKQWILAEVERELGAKSLNQRVRAAISDRLAAQNSHIFFVLPVRMLMHWQLFILIAKRAFWQPLVVAIKSCCSCWHESTIILM